MFLLKMRQENVLVMAFLRCLLCYMYILKELQNRPFNAVFKTSFVRFKDVYWPQVDDFGRFEFILGFIKTCYAMFLKYRSQKQNIFFSGNIISRKTRTAMTGHLS